MSRGEATCGACRTNRGRCNGMNRGKGTIYYVFYSTMRDLCGRVFFEFVLYKNSLSCVALVKF